MVDSLDPDLQLEYSDLVPKTTEDNPYKFKKIINTHSYSFDEILFGRIYKFAHNFNNLDTIFDNMFKNSKVFIMGVFGGPSCGKTKISKYFKDKMKDIIFLIEERDFYISENKDLNESELALINNDDNIYKIERQKTLIKMSNPDCFDHHRLKEVLQNLLAGKKEKIRKYNDDTDSFDEGEIEIDPEKTPFIMVAGQFLFKDEEIRNLIQFKIFRDVEDDIKMARMILNEEKYLKSNIKAYETFFDIYRKIIKTSYEKNTLAYKHYASLLLPNYQIGDYEDNKDSLPNSDPLAKFIKLLKQKWNDIYKKKTKAK